ncbi:LysR family transcriptional regulator [Caldimonas thermodepolymerans]|uniref:LysR family transcriptional regulator n=1 Tax=Caldimonas thermodepolymerans TaxID=215580 RepID=UPI0022365E36|nr:LysR family transcriptional regulator [Caldimonas thermodepolymerans]UZG44409.1 LysR family transcriptional regulator [Caldimonas thermodepolymerans]
MDAKSISRQAEHVGQLLALVRTVSAGSFSAAARHLGCTPSALSRQVAKLEDRLRVQLFHRAMGRLVLTQEGEVLVREARLVQQTLAQVEATAENLAEQVRGTLRIQCMPSFASTQLAPRMPALLAAYPGLQLEFELSARCPAQLGEGVDVAIYSGTLEDSDLVATRIAASQWCVCASPAYLAARGVPLHPDELRAHSCLKFGFESEWNTWRFHDGATAVAVQMPASMSASQGDMLRELALAGAGIARLARYHVEDDLKCGRLQEVLADFNSGEYEPIWLICPSRLDMSPRVRALRGFLVDALRDAEWNRSNSLS